jgi:malate dehydrogenase (oxaloacetate-decarboxylating)
MLKALIYPGLGLAAIVSHASALTDNMIIAGAQRLAALSPALKDPDDALLPDFGDAPFVNFEVAVAVAQKAIDSEEGVAAEKVKGWSVDEVREKVKERAWRAEYGEYEYDEKLRMEKSEVVATGQSSTIFQRAEPEPFLGVPPWSSVFEQRGF